MKYLCILSTAPSLKEARKISNLLLTQKLAACINLIPQIESHYRWKGRKEKAKEVLMVIKTKKSAYTKLSKVLLKHHSYDVPQSRG